MSFMFTRFTRIADITPGVIADDIVIIENVEGRVDVSAFFVFITDETVFIDNIMRSIEVDNVVIIGVLQHLIHELNIHGFIARRKNRAQTVIQFLLLYGRFHPLPRVFSLAGC